MNLSQTFGLTGVVAALMVTGCATQPQTDSALREQLEAQQARVNALESQNAELQRVAANSGTAVQTRTVAASPVGGDGDLLPPNARPGECYARVFLPPRYETITKQVVASEASEVVNVVPAKFGTAEERILVREAGKELTVIPAKFGMAEERVLVQEASERLEVVPAKYENVSERILVSPAQSYWKRGRGPVEKVDNMTGEIMCLIEEPAVYKTVTQRKLVTPAATRKVTIPAKYTTIKKRVMLEPPKTVEKEIPAQYKTVKVTKMVTPASEQRTAIPAKYQTVTEKKLSKEGQLEWQPILCETNTTGDVVARMQRALQAGGYYKGPIDGVVGSQTRSALTRYQQAKGLPSGNLTIQSLQQLGVITKS